MFHFDVRLPVVSPSLGLVLLLVLVGGCNGTSPPGSGSDESEEALKQGTGDTGSSREASGTGGGGGSAVRMDGGSPEAGDLSVIKGGSTVKIGASWRGCGTDGDCVTVSTSCDGCCGQDAISAQNKASYQVAFQNLCRGYRGGVCDCESPPTVEKCIERTCQLNLLTQDLSLIDRESTVAIGASWRGCATDDDCATVSTSCDGCCGQDAISAQKKASYEVAFKYLCIGYTGSVCDCDSPPTVEKCIERSCQLNLSDSKR